MPFNSGTRTATVLFSLTSDLYILSSIFLYTLYVIFVEETRKFYGFRTWQDSILEYNPLCLLHTFQNDWSIRLANLDPYRCMYDIEVVMIPGRDPDLDLVRFFGLSPRTHSIARSTSFGTLKLRNAKIFSCVCNALQKIQSQSQSTWQFVMYIPSTSFVSLIN